MNGLIFFEDGTVQQFGELTSVQRIAVTANRVINDLLMQERQKLLKSITKDELKQVVEDMQKEIEKEE
jgi:hypothetical protein